MAIVGSHNSHLVTLPHQRSVYQGMALRAGNSVNVSLLRHLHWSPRGGQTKMAPEILLHNANKRPYDGIISLAPQKSNYYIDTFLCFPMVASFLRYPKNLIITFVIVCAFLWWHPLS